MKEVDRMSNRITEARYFELLAAGEPAATSAYGFLGEPMGFREYRGKLAPSYQAYLRSAPELGECWEIDEPWTVVALRDEVWEVEPDDRATDRMVGTLDWMLHNPGVPPWEKQWMVDHPGQPLPTEPQPGWPKAYYEKKK